MLYHFSERPDIVRFEPRIIEGCPEPVVWAINAARQCNYLLPRDCPRVTFYAGPNTSAADSRQFLVDQSAIVAIESAWRQRVETTAIHRYHLPPDDFICIDAPAGYHVSRRAVVPDRIELIRNLPSAIQAAGAALRSYPSLWPLHDAIVSSTLTYSMIRMRNAHPRPESQQRLVAIRAYQPADSPALLALFRDTIRRINCRDYNPQQVALWTSDEITLEGWTARFEQRFAIVAELEGRIAGFTELAPDGHIDRFFVSAVHQRLGVGKALASALFAEADRQGLVRLYLDASITARPFFESMGFVVVTPQTVVVRGVEFRNFRMERNSRLTALQPSADRSAIDLG